MINGIKKQFAVLGDEILASYAIAVIGGLLGIIILRIMIQTDKEMDGYFLLGTVMAAILFCIYVLFMVVAGTRVYFNMEVSMGFTRERFFWSYFIVSWLGNLGGVLILLVFAGAEKLLWAAAYPRMEGRGLNLLSGIAKFGVPLSLAITIVGIFAGAMLLRFGRKAFWVFWVIWMAGFVLVPRMYDAAGDSPDSPLGAAGSLLIGSIRAVPAEAWAVLAAILCAVCLLTGYLVLRRQQVT